MIASKLTKAVLFGPLLLWLHGCVAPTEPRSPVGTQPASCVDPSSRYVFSTEYAQRAVMVLPGDQHPEAVRHSLALVDRVGRALTDELMAPGVRLFDQGGLTAPIPRKRRLQDRELLELASNDAREPIDRLVLYTVFADTYPQDQAFRTSIRVAARIYEVPGGNLVSGSFEATEEVTLKLPGVCDAACFTGLVGDAARPLGAMVGRQLAPRVNAMGRSYPLEFFGFSSTERQRLEDELRAFPGYQSHRVEEDTPDYVRMRYASTLLATDLGHNLRSLSECLAIPSRVEFARDRYSVRRTEQVFGLGSE